MSMLAYQYPSAYSSILHSILQLTAHLLLCLLPCFPDVCLYMLPSRQPLHPFSIGFIGLPGLLQVG